VQLVVAVAVFAALGSAVTSAGAARTPSCSLVSGAQVAKVLELTIISAQSAQAVAAGETTCFYSTATNREAVTVTYQTDNAADAYKTAHAQAGPFVRPLKGIAPNGAFYDANAEFADTPEINFLDGSTEVTIDAFAPLKRVETLARQIAGAL
jgi:hypothetical protein